MTDQPPSSAPGPRGSRWLLPVALLAVVSAAVAVYAVNRWAAEPTVPALGASAVAAAVVLVTGHRASRHGRARAYVALALLLPCALVAAVTAASDDREEDALAAQAERHREAHRPPPVRTTPLVVTTDPLDPSTRGNAPEAYTPGEVGISHGLDVTLTDATCQADEVARHVNAQASQGERLCVVTSVWKNTGARSQPLRTHYVFAEVALDDGTERALTQTERAWSFAATAGAGRPAGQLSPGDEATLRTVLAVPEGSLPLALATSDFYPGPGPTFALPLDLE